VAFRAMGSKIKNPKCVFFGKHLPSVDEAKTEKLKEDREVKGS